MELGEKKKNPSNILGYILELIMEIWRFENLKSGKNWQVWAKIFHEKNRLCRLKSYFSSPNLAKNSPVKETRSRSARMMNS